MNTLFSLLPRTVTGPQWWMNTLISVAAHCHWTTVVDEYSLLLVAAHCHWTTVMNEYSILCSRALSLDHSGG